MMKPLTNEQSHQINSTMSTAFAGGPDAPKCFFKTLLAKLKGEEELGNYAKTIFASSPVPIKFVRANTNGNILFSVQFEHGCVVDIFLDEKTKKIKASSMPSAQFARSVKGRAYSSYWSQNASVKRETTLSLNRKPSDILKAIFGSVYEWSKSQFDYEAKITNELNQHFNRVNYSISQINTLLECKEEGRVESAMVNVVSKLNLYSCVYRASKAQQSTNEFINEIKRVSFDTSNDRYIVKYEPKKMTAVALIGFEKALRYESKKHGQGHEITLTFESCYECIDFLTSGIESVNPKIISSYRDEFSELITLEDPEPASSGAVDAAKQRIHSLGLSSQFVVMPDCGAVYCGNGSGEWIPAMVYVTNADIESAISAPLRLEHKPEQPQLTH
ncbi:hypothetical protein [Vibrio splendidus]|uniref:hypothetical protein n=2 Tax=Vibrio splendidus TaxID=29497 RepID=UPI003D11A89D